MTEQEEFEFRLRLENEQSGLVKNPKEDDFGFWRTVGDMTLSIPQGVVNAVEEQGDFLDENIVSLGGIEFGDKDGNYHLKILFHNMFHQQDGKKKDIQKKDNYHYFINQKH